MTPAESTQSKGVEYPVRWSLGHRSQRSMPALPRSILHLGAGLSVALAKRRLKGPDRSLVAQEKAYYHLVRRLANTQQGRDHAIKARMGYDQFRAGVPIRVYEDLLPQIESAKRGDADVLWPGRTSLFALSSGTSSGRTKYVPVTEEMLAHFRRAGIESLLRYGARVGHAGVFQGRHLFLGGSTALERIASSSEHPGFAGDLSGITALNLPSWAETHLYEPGEEIAQMTDWPAKLEAIADRTVSSDISLIAGIPSWLIILAHAVLAKASRGKIRPAHLRAVWPNLECIVHGGVPLGPFADELKALAGPGVTFHEVFPASEGFIAAQDTDSNAGLRLIADAGLFFEFIPMREFSEDRLSGMGMRALPLAEVRTGIDYAVVITTPAGLCRYVIGDVVRFTSLEPYRIIYVGRTRLQLSAFGEHVIEKELTDALLTVCQRHGWTIANFHVAPWFSEAGGEERGRHEWWIELRTPTKTTPTGPIIATELDAELQRLNADYAGKRQGDALDQPIVRLVMPGLFEQWMKAAGKWGGQGKMPRCRSDRHIADELATIARFCDEA